MMWLGIIHTQSVSYALSATYPSSHSPPDDATYGHTLPEFSLSVLALFAPNKYLMPPSKPPRAPCGICQQEFLTQQSQQLHEAAHEEGNLQGIFACEICQKTFSHDDQLYSHLGQMHDIFPLHGTHDLLSSREHRLDQKHMRDYFDSAWHQSYHEEFTVYFPQAIGMSQIMRVDFLIRSGGTLFVIECDELQHKQTTIYGVYKDSIRPQKIKHGLAWDRTHSLYELTLTNSTLEM
jgi:hypothetical protein